jgi:TolA-binding protein
MGFFVGLVIGVAAMVGKDVVLGNNTSSKYESDSIKQENERLKNRCKEMQEQIDKLIASNEKKRNDIRTSDDELDDMEEELEEAKRKIKILQAQNKEYAAKIEDYKNAVETLKFDLDAERRK